MPGGAAPFGVTVWTGSEARSPSGDLDVLYFLLAFPERQPDRLGGQFGKKGRIL